MFLLLMESLAQNGGQPPSIPYLSILTADDSTVAVYTNQSMQYSSKAADILCCCQVRPGIGVWRYAANCRQRNRTR